MEEKYNESTKNRPEGERPIDAPSVLIDLEEYSEQLKDEKQWKKGDKNAIVVFKSDKLRIILIAMRSDAEMTTEHPENIFSVQVLEGKLSMKISGSDQSIKKDQMMVLHERIPYVIKAEKKSVFLLTMVE